MWNPLGRQEVTENLEDAGCSIETIEKFLTLLESGSYSDQYKFLRKERVHLLDNLHTAQKRLDCFDYLLYQLEKQNKEKNTEL